MVDGAEHIGGKGLRGSPQRHGVLIFSFCVTSPLTHGHWTGCPWPRFRVPMLPMRLPTMLPRANLELSGAYYDLGDAYDGRCDVTCILLHSSRVILPPSFFPFYYVYNYVYIGQAGLETDMRFQGWVLTPKPIAVACQSACRWLPNPSSQEKALGIIVETGRKVKKCTATATT